MTGVPVNVAITAGGGSLAGPPSVTSSQPTSVGTWTLGNSVGTNSITITVQGIQPFVVSTNSSPGAPALLVPSTTASLPGTVGQQLTVPLSVSLRDAFGNGLSGATLNLAVTGGGSTAPTITTDAAGAATVPAWTLGTVKGINTLTVSVGAAITTFSAAAAAGPLQTLQLASGDNQAAFAGTPLPQPAIFAPVDQYGNRLDSQVALFSIVTGGGSLAASTANSSPSGGITMPSLTLGKSAVPQQVLATVGTKTALLHATVATSYTIDVRFWGPAMTADQQALFTNAAARIRAIVVGSLPLVDGTGADPAVCGVSGQPVLSEIIPGVIIYASVQPIDGPGLTLAQAGPCYTRSAGDLRTVIGSMQFDVADLNSLSNGGSLQDVITHEMLHVLGVGTFWNAEGLLTGYNTAAVAYTGAGGLSGCIATGGTTSCATAVPVENTGGAGTFNSHWRESIFGSELMTGYANAGPMPLSVITVRSLADIGYTVNTAGADPYSIFVGSIHANDALIPSSSLLGPWEKGLSNPHRPLPSSGASFQTGNPK